MDDLRQSGKNNGARVNAGDGAAIAVEPGLRSDCLSYMEVLAQSISVIAPSTVPAAILGLIFAAAGDATWLSFLIGMLGLVAVSYNINQFARRSASAGSLYSYIVKGLGPTTGVLGGWALLFGYTLTGMSTLCGFSVVSHELLSAYGISLSPLWLYALGASGAFLFAYKDVQLSARAMLFFEGAALAAVLALGTIVWRHSDFQIDVAQIRLQGATPGGVLMGVVLVVFAFSGFESSTSLGEEAKDPLRSIPRSVIQSVVVAGLVFIFMAYVTIIGFKDMSADLAKSEAPLSYLATELGWPRLGAFINIGILLSFFSCTLASINSTARIIYAMARHGLMYEALGTAHDKNETPHIAAAVAATITLIVTTSVYLLGASPFESQGYFGTLCSFGFLTAYTLISLAAPAYLYKIGEGGKGALTVSGLAVAFMLVPFLGVIGVPGSELFPPPAYPNNLLVWIFLAYMAVAGAWLASLKILKPRKLPDVLRANGIEGAYRASASTVSSDVN
ncbi:APC family permease [Methylocystis parvus]|uniref:APC family permease n=2 Tax=Methylocystis parvus TaxID=134 RepID=A0A6B8MCW1_9HYPH|nr:APC family permease [Methylocystis parvus]